MNYTCPSGHVVLLDDDVVLPGRISIGSHGYPQIWFDGTVVLLHRWLLGLERGGRLIGDHINRNVLDNRRSNLRAVTPAESNLNREVARRDLPVGVHRTGSGRFEARLKRNRKQQHLGTFDTVEAAEQARATALLV